MSGKTEEAINFYASVFTGAPGPADSAESKVEVLARYGEGEKSGIRSRYGRQLCQFEEWLCSPRSL